MLRPWASLSLSTLVNPEHTAALGDFVRHLAVYSARIRTSLNGQPLANESYEKLQQLLHVNDKPVDKAELTALFNRVHEAMNGKASAAALENLEGMKSLQALYQSLNSQLSVVMKVKDESVEADLETFRCPFSGA